MDSFPSLGQHDIYALPAGAYFSAKPEDYYIIYAPLKDIFFLATPEKVHELEDKMQKGIKDEAFSQARNLDNWETVMQMPDTLTNAFLLLNERCNFNCKYCYSAGGRSKDEISVEQMRIIIDKVLQNSIEKDIPGIKVTFMGGGEPLLSLPLIKATVRYASENAARAGKKVNFSISTNGSLIDDEIINLILDHSFQIQVSFEILPDIQNRQRGQYNKVHAGILRLLKNKIPVVLRATITDINVDRMEEMVETAVGKYPDIKTLVFESVVDTETYSTPELMQKYYVRFIHAFRKASHLAKRHGIRLTNSADGAIRSLRKRFCSPMFCLTPFGTLMDCPNVSSPAEPGYKERVYGDITTGKVRIDEEAYRRIMKNYLDEDPLCRQCWAKWNCGGGCQNQRLLFTPEQFRASCHYFREMLLYSIIDALAENFKEHQGVNLFEYITHLAQL